MENINKNPPRNVSVIIPCYKDAATLGRAINSVVVQTVPVFEIIVVNDCSPDSDAIEAVISAFPKVIYLKNRVNQGLAATRNAGLMAAKGDVVTFLDADDELHPQKIELQLSVLGPRTVVSCNVKRMPADGIHCPRAVFSGSIRTKTVTQNTLLLLRNSLTGAALMASRELLLNFGGYDSELRSCEDFDLWLRFVEADVTIITILLPLYIYRCNPNGLSKNYRNVSYWELAVLKKHLSQTRYRNHQAAWPTVVFSVWLGRHLLRARISADEQLMNETLANIYRLVRPSWFANLYCWIGKGLVITAASWLLVKWRRVFGVR